MFFPTYTISPSPYALLRWGLKYPKSAWFHRFVVIFGMELLPEYVFSVAFWSNIEVAEEDFFTSRNFSIIFHRKSILLSFLAWIVATAVATADITTLVINC